MLKSSKLDDLAFAIILRRSLSPIEEENFKVKIEKKNSKRNSKKKNSKKKKKIQKKYQVGKTDIKS